jgi:16S rRNA processing protein RimM
MIPRSKSLLLGKITKKWGFEGHLLIRPEHQGFLKNKLPESVFIDIQGKLVPFFIVTSREHPPAGWIVQLSDLSEVILERVLQANVYVRNDQLPIKDKTPESVAGYEVTDKHLGAIGHVRELIERDLQPLLAVTHPSGIEILIPYTDEIVTRSDHRRRRLHIVSPEGLVELYLNP